MSLVIVPLAGPDFYSEEFGIRPLHKLVDGGTLIDVVLLSRPWVLNVINGVGRIIFVLRGFNEHSEKMKAHLISLIPNSEFVMIENVSMGSPFSVIAAISQIKNIDEPIVIDLADILFDTDLNVDTFFQDNESVSGLIPYFHSSIEKFSYLRIIGNSVVEAREKTVISPYASAGVYCFRGFYEFLCAFNYCVNNPKICQVNGSYFICPSFNGLIEKNKNVLAIEVSNPEPIGAIFHQ
jgi:hypothetical protein